MFTGLIEAICVVKLVRPNVGGASLMVDLGNLAEQCKIGDSIAINGACLTVAYLAPQSFDPAQDRFIVGFEISPETLAKSTLGRLKPLSKVNVERAMKPTDRFGGHFVQGHIDGTAAVKAMKKQGEFADIEFAAPPELLSQMVVKGSVAVDGISLTIVSLNQSSFSVALIPQTLKRTTLGTAKVGDAVNIETDIVVKTIKNYLDKILLQGQSLTVEKLREMGF